MQLLARTCCFRHRENHLLFAPLASVAVKLGSLGLILATVGVFGVMSYSISQRTREIGIRIALGAQRAEILRLVGRQGLLVVAAGIVVGFLLSFAVGKLIQDFLVGINSTDPVTYTAITLFLGLVAMAACFVPVRRALRIDPILVLRNE